MRILDTFSVSRVTGTYGNLEANGFQYEFQISTYLAHIFGSHVRQPTLGAMLLGHVLGSILEANGSHWQLIGMNSSHISNDHIWSGIPWDIPSQVSGFLANPIPSHIFPTTR